MEPTSASDMLGGASSSGSSSPPVPHIRIVPHLEAPRSLHFDVVDKDVPEGFVLKIGRFTDKQALPNRVTFKSKVVSRGHAEIFTEGGKFYIRDTKSSSGTFLNHARLSPPGVESKPTQLKDGDVVQLGVDYQGGTQEIYRCVKMRLELNRSWQQQANPFRLNTLKVIRSLTTANAASATDCCICLFRIASFQSLFVAPCSHVYHYKCIRPLLVANHPGFLCPLCRTFADLEDSVEIDDPIEKDEPAEDAVEAVENVPIVPDQEVENVQEPELNSRPTRVEVVAGLTEEAYAPTPPSEQAHTFQPLESAVTHPTTTNSTIPSMTLEEPANVSSQEHTPISTALDDANPPGALESTSRAQLTNTLVQTSLNESGGSPAQTSMHPVDIVQPSVHTQSGVAAPSYSVGTPPPQPSPASAFFMAPSPPAFTSNSGATPVPYASPSRGLTNDPQSSVSPSSPSNHMAAAGHMIQNFVRNISIPSRNRSRSRTNSNSPLNPSVSQQPTNFSSSAPSGSLGSRLNLAVPGSTGQGDLHSDVYGKTLVVTPPPIGVLNGEGSENQGAAAGGSRPMVPFSLAPDLASVSEIDMESSPNRRDGQQSVEEHTTR
ncbi:hypothetical protein BGZ94_009137 [Podila epigama]|nr:hypothetical protein BGZ94_009137 [Podila epigama]